MNLSVGIGFTGTLENAPLLEPLREREVCLVTKHLRLGIPLGSEKWGFETVSGFGRSKVWVWKSLRVRSIIVGTIDRASHRSRNRPLVPLDIDSRNAQIDIPWRARERSKIRISAQHCTRCTASEKVLR